MTRVAKHVTGQGMRLTCAWQVACAFGVLLEGGNPPSLSGGGCVNSGFGKMYER